MERTWGYDASGNATSEAKLVPRHDSTEHFDVKMAWGDKIELPDHTDGGAVERNQVSVSYLTRLQAESRNDMGKAEAGLDGLLGS